MDPPSGVPRPACSTVSSQLSDAGSPPHWDPIDPAHGNTSLVLLSKDNPKHAAELTQVHSSWTRTGGAGSIVAVHRVQNLELWRAYEAMKAELQQSGSLIQSDMIVYHGTRTALPELIHAGSVGFDPSKGLSQNGDCCSWFAENASYSSRYFSGVGSSTVPFGRGDYARWTAAVDAGKPFDGLKQIFQAQITVTHRDGPRMYQGTQRVVAVDRADRAYPQYLITFR